MNHKFLLALGLAFTSALSTGSARADEFLSSYRFNVGPDVRWWAGNTSTATNGLQFVTNYGADFKFVKPDAFAISFGSGSGYLDTQTRQLIPNNFIKIPPLQSGVASAPVYRAQGELDVLSYVRLDLKALSFFQPYVRADYNYSPNKTLNINQVFAFSGDKDRDLRTSFGSGDFYTTKVGSVVNFSRDLAADLSWKRNYGTNYSPFDYQLDERHVGASDSFAATLQYAGDRWDFSVGYERTKFEVSSARFEDFFAYPLQQGLPPVHDPANPIALERWQYGDLDIFNAKVEFRPDAHWFLYAEGIYSQQAANQRGRIEPDPSTPGAYLLFQPLAPEKYNANPVKYAGLFGLGYSAKPWTLQLQGIVSIDEANGANLKDDKQSAAFLPRRERYGAEGIVDYRVSQMLGLNFRLAYLHVTGFQFPPGFYNPSYNNANVATAYVSARFKF